MAVCSGSPSENSRQASRETKNLVTDYFCFVKCACVSVCLIIKLCFLMYSEDSTCNFFALNFFVESWIKNIYKVGKHDPANSV